MSEVRSLFISKPKKGRRLAISDIHGCYRSFKRLIKQLKLTKKDQLFLMGDLCNRGPATKKVINYILELQESGYQIYILRGNHEQMLINAASFPTEKLKKRLKNLNSEKLLEDDQIPARYLNFLNETYHYFELEDYFLVHAGFDFNNQPFENTKAMLNIKDFKADKEQLKYKRIVVGHSPQSIDQISHRIKLQKRKLYIDNGCLNVKNKGQGNLLCLDLDKHTFIVQPNIEK